MQPEPGGIGDDQLLPAPYCSGDRGSRSDHFNAHRRRHRFHNRLQYELALGGGEPVGTFYFAYQPDGASQAAAFEVDGKPSSVRIPIYSSDPDVRTTFSTFDTSLRAAPESKTTVGEVLGGVAVVALYLGLPLYATAKELEKAYEPDLSHIDFPDIDPELLQPAPASSNAGHERR